MSRMVKGYEQKSPIMPPYGGDDSRIHISKGIIGFSCKKCGDYKVADLKQYNAEKAKAVKYRCNECGEVSRYKLDKREYARSITDIAAVIEDSNFGKIPSRVLDLSRNGALVQTLSDYEAKVDQKLGIEIKLETMQGIPIFRECNIARLVSKNRFGVEFIDLDYYNGRDAIAKYLLGRKCY